MKRDFHPGARQGSSSQLCHRGHEGGDLPLLDTELEATEVTIDAPKGLPGTGTGGPHHVSLESTAECRARAGSRDGHGHDSNIKARCVALVIDLETLTGHTHLVDGDIV